MGNWGDMDAVWFLDDQKTVLIVSHSNDTLAELCSRVIWMHGGKIKMDGPAEEVLAAYSAYMDKKNANITSES